MSSSPAECGPWSAVPGLFAIRRKLRRWRPEVVHVHENYDPRLVALTAGYRTVFTVHDPVHLWGPGAHAAEERIFKRWFRRAERFVVHGQHLPRTRADSRPDSNHGDPTWALAAFRAPPLDRDRRPSFFSADSRDTRAWRSWSKGCVSCGNGCRREAPGDERGRSGPPRSGRPRISLILEIHPREGRRELLAEASLVVLPYTQASQSGVGLLAIAAGVPVVVSDLGALPDLAFDSSFVFEAANPRALADTIERHLEDGVDVRRGLPQPAQPRFSRPRSSSSSLRHDGLAADCFAARLRILGAERAT